MKIGLRGGHSSKAKGAVGIVDEYNQMQSFYKHVEKLLTDYGHTVVNCNSDGATQGAELSEGARKANNAGVELFISLHMNSFNGEAHGTECLVSSASSGSYTYAKKICENFSTLGFKNRGVKVSTLYEMKHIKAPNIIFEVCFCDSPTDIAIYNKYSWTQLAHTLCNAIDRNIPLDPPSTQQLGYVVTDYLPGSYKGYDGVDIKYILEYFDGVKCYVRGNNKGVWIETEYLPLSKCQELKCKLGSWFYEIKQ